jgi:D-sedoheptulose 7-phosphate isomerase
MEENNFVSGYLSEVGKIAQSLDKTAIEKIIGLLVTLRSRKGRLFILGVGGSAANATHAVNDFRKLTGIEAYAPTDNVSELTARVNDEGWETVFVSWLKGSNLSLADCVFVFSVGGGSLEKNVSVNLVKALQYAKEIGTCIIGIVGRDGGYTAQVATACVVVPVINPSQVTPHTEAFQGIIWHLLVSHPALKINEPKWTGIK